MRNEATEEMLVFTTEVCRKYEQVKTIAEGAEASWKQNLEMAATSKYPGEKEMYDQQAAEDLSRYTAAKEWLKLVDGAVAKVREKKARLVLKQNCFAGATMKSILIDKKAGIYMSRSTATRYKKCGLTELAVHLASVQDGLEKAEKKIHENEP